MNKETETEEVTRLRAEAMDNARRCATFRCSHKSYNDWCDVCAARKKALEEAVAISEARGRSLHAWELRKLSRGEELDAEPVPTAPPGG